MIIGLTGLAGSGKDTVAALLAMKGFHRYAFADGVREEVGEAIEWIAKHGQGGRADNSPLIGWYYEILAAYGPIIVTAIQQGKLTPEMVWEKPTRPLMRELLQKHGTEFRRAQDSEYWVKKLMTQLDAKVAHFSHASTPPPGQYAYYSDVYCNAAISDVRFPNETEAIRASGGRIWRVKRKLTVSPAEHISESGQSEIVADVDLYNDGTVYDLALKVKDLL